MADDIDSVVVARIAILGYLRKHGLLFPGMDERNHEPHELLDALIAAVRAEKDDRYGRSKSMDKRLRLRDSRLTVVKLRDDETSPVAAPCAIAGACQYGAVHGLMTEVSKTLLNINEQTLTKIPAEAYAVRALEAAALREPDDMERLAHTIEGEPHYAVCEAQWLRGIAWRLKNRS